MAGQVVAFLLVSSLWQGARATAPPAAKNTTCPAYPVTPAPNTRGFICGAKGTLSDPSYLSRTCAVPEYGLVTFDVSDCYRICSADPGCKSFAYDPFTQYCKTYGKSLKDKGFKASSTGPVHYDLHGCFVCDQPPPPPPKLRCPDYPSDISSPAPGYICGHAGTMSAAPAAVFYDVEPYQACYDLCVRYDTVGQCTAFAGGYDPAEGYRAKCALYNTTLRAGGFKPTFGDEYIYSNLRGCFECQEPIPNPPRTPSSVCQGTTFSNLNFSQQTFNSDLNITQPTYWNPSPYVQSLNSTDGTSYLSFRYIPGLYDDVGISQYGGNLRSDDVDPGRFYNLTYDLAIQSYYQSNDPAALICSFTGQPGDQIKLSDPAYGPNFKQAGPYTFSGSSYQGGLQLAFYLSCYSNQQPAVGGATVLLKNVRLTQHGRNVVTR